MTEDVYQLCVRRRDVLGNVVVLELTAPDGKELPPFTAGAHIDLELGDGLIRQYSLCNDPESSDHYLLGVLLEPQSRGGSLRVHADLYPGRTVTVAGPRNNFPLVEEATHSILLAGGIGITPLIAMAWRLHRLGASFELHYCTRTRSAAAFADRLAATPFANKVSLHLDDGEAEQIFDADKVLQGPAVGWHVYVCGPSGFIDYIVDRAKSHGWHDRNVHLEHFSAEVKTAGATFTVRAARSGIEVEVPEGRSIAEVLNDAGIEVPLSCEQGVCGTCLTRVIEGIPDHRDVYLMDDEKATNSFIMPCCSRAKTELLVLDI